MHLSHDKNIYNGQRGEGIVYQMDKANLLAQSIKGFVQYVQKSYLENNRNLSHPDKLYRLKLLVEEYKLLILSDELMRINRFVYEKDYTKILVDRIRKAIKEVGEYIDQNDNDLFIFTARLKALRMMVDSYD
ncbi:hypothetical protein [Niallia sp. Krafla_26]|uniref:hypothetical protein n=1 Tax=Niallia sp. Krafla_26 TaxID=3064703 RepID=UPI003D17C9EB